jgi:ABC-type branched-subunit amino acid transport system ATPase component
MSAPDQPLAGVEAPPAPPATPPPTGRVLLEARAITKRFGGLVAVNAVDFSLPERSICSLIGPNGAGKTTFFNIIAGLYAPTEGQVLFEGRNVIGLNPNEITRRGIARTFQNIRLFKAMSARDNVLVGMHCRLKANALGAVLRTPGVVREEREANARARELLDYVGLADRDDSAAWRSPAPWPPSRSCCCSTSRPPA